MKNQKEFADKLLEIFLASKQREQAEAARRSAQTFQKTRSYITFGTYPQTADGTDKTPIEWMVLKRDGNKALLISRYGLTVKPYHKSDVSTTWEKCSLRTWLNETFMKSAFTIEEQKGIALTNVDSSRSQGYGEWDTDGGNNTQDKIFLLSYAEAKKYFNVKYNDRNNVIARVDPTAYAIAQGANTHSGYTTASEKAAGYWWLRSPGRSLNDAACVRIEGSLNYYRVNYGYLCVRPAMWVDLSLINGKESKNTEDIVKSAKNTSAMDENTATRNDVQTGSYLTFGTYPQTADGTDETPIEWLVLERNGNKALLVSRYNLDAQPYNTEWTDITWEKCTLRTWLNRTFMNKAFTWNEKNSIVLTDVDNSKNQGYSKWDTDGGKNTQDKIFLLSYAEANKYFGVESRGHSGSDENVKPPVATTAYAFAQGADCAPASGKKVGVWWLRSPGSIQLHAACVYFDGSLGSCSASYDGICVRPAMWVNLKSDIFQSGI